MKKDLTTNDFEYEIIYCSANNYRNRDMWHCAYGNLQRVCDIISWCKENDLIIKSIKAVRI